MKIENPNDILLNILDRTPGFAQCLPNHHPLQAMDGEAPPPAHAYSRMSSWWGAFQLINVLCEASSFKHYNLNSLGIKGFGTEEKLIDYIKLVTERDVALKKIYLYDKEQCQSCDPMKQILLLLSFYS